MSKQIKVLQVTNNIFDIFFGVEGWEPWARVHTKSKTIMKSAGGEVPHVRELLKIIKEHTEGK